MSPVPLAAALPGFERSVALVIGINDYTHGVPPLQSAVSDATAVAEALERQGFEVIRLLDAHATHAALSAVLFEHLPALQPPPDRLLLYFAGHGLTHTDEQHELSGFLLPADVRRDDPSSYWSMDTLRRQLRQLPCKHLLLILDCCFAGAFPHSSFRDLQALSPPTPLYMERFRHFSSRRSFQVLLSTSHDELASDRLMARSLQEFLGPRPHSPFAYALLEALQPSSRADTNEDGLLTVSELYTYLRDRLLTLLPTHAAQTPSLRHLDWHDGGEFLFLLSGAFPALPSAALLSKHSNPYLGLHPFSSEQRHLFFGRERLIDSLLERLRAQPLLVLCAPSGAGKSSMVQAGLVPRLREQASWTIPPALQPADQPFQQLSRWLSSLLPGVPVPSGDDLSAAPHLAAKCLCSLLTFSPLLSAVLVVDPLEELVTARVDSSTLLRFLQALAGLVQLRHRRFRMVLVLRADFESHFVSLLFAVPLLLEHWRESLCPLPPMNREELRRCIQKPAEASVLFFASGLVERMLDDVERMPGALPLLSVALRELFDAYLDSGRADRTLSCEDYGHLGNGITGVLLRRAELVFTGAPPPSSDSEPPLTSVAPEALPAFQRTLRNVLLRMVSSEGGELARRRVTRAELEYPQPEENSRVHQTLTALEANRLVVASHDGGPSVEPAHDALLSAWPRLHDWAWQARRELPLLRRISEAASEWVHHNQSATFLWADARLEQLGLSSSILRDPRQALALPVLSFGRQPSDPLALNVSESRFLRSSAALRHQLRSQKYVLAVATTLGLLSLALAAHSNANQAQQLAREAEKQRMLVLIHSRLLQAEQMRIEDPTKALLILRETSPSSEGVSTPWLQLAMDVGSQPVSSAVLVGHTSGLTQATFSADGSRVLTASKDGTARLWRSDGRGDPLVLRGHTSWLTCASFSPDGAYLLTASDDSTARIWRSDGRGEPLVLRGHTSGLISASFSPDGSHVLTASWDGTARIWRSNGRGEPIVLRGHASSLTSASFSRDGSYVLTTSSDGIARIWRSDGHGEPLILRVPMRTLTSASFSWDSSQVLTTAEDGTARIWRSDGHGEPLVLQSPLGRIISASFGPSSARVLTISTDGALTLWRADGHGAPHILQRLPAQITSASLSPDDSYVLTTSEDGTASIVPIYGHGEPLSLRGHTSRITSASFSSDGSRVVTASEDGAARIWSSDGHGEPLVLQSHYPWAPASPFVTPTSPSLFQEAFETVTTACLSADDRERYLLESPDKAREGYEQCQRAYGRCSEPLSEQSAAQSPP